MQKTDFSKPDNVRVIPDAGDIETVGADKIAKLSAETSRDRSVAAWDQRIVNPPLFAIGRVFETWEVNTRSCSQQYRFRG